MNPGDRSRIRKQILRNLDFVSRETLIQWCHDLVVSDRGDKPKLRARIREALAPRP